ncbi:hypothetical protein AB0J35_32095 [Nonomuraea angiospora]|uniref:hypothetical protein n=1 Tax=Nonomuraea angiospora TaxID=46172 RepID=UPI0034129E59
MTYAFDPRARALDRAAAGLALPPARDEERRLPHRVARKKAIVTVARAMIVIVWHVLVTGTPYNDLGEDYVTTRKAPEKEAQRLIAKLQALGHKVTIEPEAA